MSGPLPLLLRRPHELCADGRTAVGSAGLLVGAIEVSPHDPVTAGAVPGPVLPDLAPVIPLGNAELDWRRLAAFRDRQPQEVLDRMIVALPRGFADQLTLAGLDARAAQLGLPVQAWTDQLDVHGPVTGAGHRVLHLDARGAPAPAGEAVSVRVLPAAGRAVDPYGNLPHEALALATALPQPATRIVFTGAGVQLGMPPALVRAVAAELLAGFVPRATAGSGTRVAGYAELVRLLHAVPVGEYGWIEAGATGAVVVRHAGTGALAVLDPVTAAPVLLPDDPAGITLARAGAAGSAVRRLADDLIGGRITVPEGVEGVRELTLPATGVRVRWAEDLAALAGRLPEHAAGLAAMGRQILRCPQD